MDDRNTSECINAMYKSLNPLMAKLCQITTSCLLLLTTSDLGRKKLVPRGEKVAYPFTEYRVWVLQDTPSHP